MSIVYDLMGQGPLVVLARGIGDSRHSYWFVAPARVAAGYQVANVDIRGCGASSVGWDGYGRTDISEDLIASVRAPGGPAVIVGQSISGGAATVAAATAPDLIAGVIELAPFTRTMAGPARADAGQALPVGVNPAGTRPHTGSPRQLAEISGCRLPRQAQ